MDKGVIFVHENIRKTLELIKSNPENQKLQEIKGKVIKEASFLKDVKTTGNLYHHFSKFKADIHKYSDEFKFIEEYGIVPNEKMADYLAKNYPEEINNIFSLSDLNIGEIYTNSEIRDTFKCSDMGGMRRSKETNSLVLIAKHNNPLYDDQWTEDGTLNYTGMGKKGDQSISFAQNKTLATSNSSDIKVYLFESYADNEYYYYGEVYLSGSVFVADEDDENGVSRKVLKFPLRKKEENPVIVNLFDIEKSIASKEKELKKMSPDLVKEKAKKVTANRKSKEVVTIYRERDPLVSEHTKNRANGICDLCGKEAPFKDKNGKPYLEEHHVITLAEGGPDRIYNTIAACPNCHRRMHVLKSKKDIELVQKVLLKYLLDDEDHDNVKLFKDLFN